jgi:hypothetical protein
MTLDTTTMEDVGGVQTPAAILKAAVANTE